ncbi:hypothetical protein [Nostoc sp.]|uniref:hypothetical protein n=1 Tax=Nostoc sp. TaxID=1180 RepID=UPI002FFB6D33
MKTRNAFVTFTICVLSGLTTTFFVNVHKVEARPTTDCSKNVTGTYLATNSSSEFGSFRTIITFTQDGNYFASSSIQSGVPSLQPLSNVQGSWKCIGDREITVTAFNFRFQTATLPAGISRSDLRAIFDPKTGTVEVEGKLRTFDINANPLVDDVPVIGTFTFTGQRVKAGI